MDSPVKKRRVGIVGFGRLGIDTCTRFLIRSDKSVVSTSSSGQYLYEVLVSDYSGSYEVAFVWNRSPDKMQGVVPQQLVLLDLGNAVSMSPDLIVEVAHPSIVADYGKLFLQIADFMVTTAECTLNCRIPTS